LARAGSNERIWSAVITVCVLPQSCRQSAIKKLGLFCTIGPSRPRRPPDALSCPSLALFCTTAPQVPPAGSRKLGSFSRISGPVAQAGRSAAPRPPPIRPGRLGLFRTFCLALDTSSLKLLAKLASFCALDPSNLRLLPILGSFCMIGSSHGPTYLSGGSKLGSFCAFRPLVLHPSALVPPGLAIAWWNDRTVERWGISPVGNWVCFADFAR
jgi:hypothetical protein